MKYNGSTYIYRKDVQGNIISLLDSNGRIVVKYAYDAWGNYAAEALDYYDGKVQFKNVDSDKAFNADYEKYKQLANINPFRYRGYYYDTETELYFLKTRYYDPEVGRFISADSIEYLDPETINGLNLYAYCNNNPVMNIDPEGTWSWKNFWKGMVVLAVGLVVATVAAVTVLSGGTAAPVLIGAAIGGIVSGGISIGTQLAMTGTIDVGRLLVDVTVGGVLGAFGGSAIGKIGMMIAGGLTSGAGSVAGDLVQGEKVNIAKAIASGVIGSLIALTGGAGAQYGKLGARQAALATKRQILSRNASGGYRHVTNFNFAIGSNTLKIAKITKVLNIEAIISIIETNIKMFELNAYFSLAFA